MKAFTAKRSDALLKLLISQFPVVKRARIQQYLKHGSVCVNGHVITLHRHVVKTGDKIDFLARPQAQAKRFASERSFSVLHEDNFLLVVEKPAGLLTMATEEERAKTLYAQVTEYVRLQSGGRGRIFIVHRLDRETSGLIVFAKTAAAKMALQGNWDQVVKKYAAITEGVPPMQEDTIQGYLREDLSRRVWATKHAVSNSKPASTRYRVLKSDGRYALLEVQLETGRKNQIRAHLQSIGCPVAGDGKYGAQTDPIRRLALHSTELSFPHPETGEQMNFRSRPPAEFSHILARGK